MNFLLDAYGRPIGAGPGANKFKGLANPLEKVFEGEVIVRFYKDKIEGRGRCFHCKSDVTVTMPISPAQSRAIDHDQQFKKNMFDLCGEKMQEDHQCGLIYDGRDTWEDLERKLGHR